MAIIYRSAGPWGTGKGVNLLAGEVDGNFYELNTRVGDVESTIPTLTSITGFTVSGNAFYVHLSNGSAQGPFILPQTTWNFRGAWQPTTHYTTNDVITAPDGGLYMVLISHDSQASFSPYANDGVGNAYYGLMLMQTNVLPPGGATNTVLSKLTSGNFDAVWRLVGEMPVGGTTNQIPRKDSNADYDIVWGDNTLDALSNLEIDASPEDNDFLRYDLAADAWVNQSSAMFSIVRAPTYTPSSSDTGGFVIIENGSSNVTITIPTNAADPFRIGAEISIHQEGTGVVTIVGNTGVTLLYSPQFDNTLLGQYATATIKKTAINEWRLFGLLTQL